MVCDAEFVLCYLRAMLSPGAWVIAIRFLGESSELQVRRHFSY